MLRIKFIILAIHCKWYQLIWDGNFKIVKVFFVKEVITILFYFHLKIKSHAIKHDVSATPFHDYQMTICFQHEKIDYTNKFI